MKIKRAIYVLSFLVAMIFFSSCATSKTGREMKNTIGGDWLLQTIVMEGIKGEVKTKLFNETYYSCFIGSSWNFISNNSMGSYTLDGMTKDCPSLKRLIRWSIYEPKDAAREFQFKRLDDKKNAMDNGDGYRLKITELDDKNMQLRSDISFEGTAAAVIYNFKRK